MPGAINISYEVGGKRKRREREQIDLKRQLLDEGFTPSEVNRVTKTYLDKGLIELPTERPTGKFKLKSPAGGGEGPAQQVPEMAPIEIPRKRRLWSRDPRTGRLTMSNEIGPEDVVKDLDTDEDGDGGGRNKPETPQQKAARQTLNQYDAAVKSGKPLSADLERRAADASRFLGLGTRKVPVGKGPRNKGLTGKAGDILFGERKQKYAEIPSYTKEGGDDGGAYDTPEAVRAAFRRGEISRSEARKLIQGMMPAR